MFSSSPPPPPILVYFIFLSLSLSFFLSFSLSLSLLYIIFLIFFFINAVCCLTIVLRRVVLDFSQSIANSMLHADGRSRSRKALVHARSCPGRGTSCMPAGLGWQIFFFLDPRIHGSSKIRTDPRRIRMVSRQECERQQCERHQCEANSANANSAKGSTVRMPTVRMRQRCECQQCECDSSAKDDSPNCAKPCPQLRQLDLDF